MSDEKKRSYARVRVLLRVGMGLIIAAGMWTAIRTSQRAGALQREYDELARKVGYLPVEDSDKVWIVAIPTGEKLVWRFRIHLPANFGVSEVHYSGLISGTTPRKGGSSGGSHTSGARAEPVEYQMTVAFLKEDGRWSLHNSTRNGRGRGGVSRDLGKLLDANAPLKVESIGANGPQSFATDEPICLLRVRGTEPVADADGADPLYEGLYYYLVPQEIRGKFEAAQRGAQAQQ